MEARGVVRFSSCRGVEFEIKPRADPFALPAPTIPAEESNHSSKSWLPWNIESISVHGSSRRSSIHFCDIEGEVEKTLELSLEEGHKDENGEQILVQSVSKPEQTSKPIRKNETRLSIILFDQGLFTVYKRLFVVCLALNTIALALAAAGKFTYARNRAIVFSIGNLLALTVCRSEAILRVVFWFVVKALGRSWVPFLIKNAATSFLQSLGGIHSGCGISCIAWLIYALVLTLQDREKAPPEIIGVAFTILSLLCFSSFAAFPLVRHIHHNLFERIHRFAGWAALILLWDFVMLKTSYDPMTKSYKNGFGFRLIREQEFWFTLAVTILIILPWVTIRRVPVNISSPSGHAAIIKFPGGVKPGILGRISPSPLSEWHAFGIISNGKSEHMMLAGAVGDFTKSLVSNPPSHLWIRQVHFAGLPYLTNMYNRVLLVATGSGLGVFLSFLLQPCRADICLLWVAKGVEQSFGKEIKDMMSGHPKDKVIVHDTALLGRPNVSEMSVTAARNWKAEVVIVTSNPEVSRDIVNACKTAGISAFGPIWDS